MKLTKNQIRKIIKEGLSDEAYEAGYNDALRNRPHGSNPEMRDLDPKAYDHGFDTATADRMDLQRPSGTQGYFESVIREQWDGEHDPIDEAQELIYYSLRSAEDDIERRGIKLGTGEFAQAVQRALRRFR